MGFNSLVIGQINKVIAMRININSHVKEKAFFYIVPCLAIYNLILGMP
jgi:hypothetical protein